MNEIRSQSKKKAALLSIPGIRDENFKFTFLGDFKFLEGNSVGEASDPLGAERIALEPGESVLVVRWDRVETYGEALPSGVTFEKVEDGEELALIPSEFDEDIFAHQAKSQSAETWILRVARDTEVAHPIRLVFCQESDRSDFDWTLSVGKNSRVQVVEEWKGMAPNDAAQIYALGRFYLGQGAQLKLSQLQDLDQETSFFIRESFKIDQDAKLEISSVFVGGKKGQYRGHYQPLAPGANIQIKNAVKGLDQQHFDFWTHLFHDVTDTQSSLRHWTVLDDRAKAVFNGSIVITKKGLRTDSFEKNFNLMLSNRAVVDTVPKLEIWTDDVKCAHGANVAPVDQEQIFYLQARGVSAGDAERMVVSGFTQVVVDDFPLELLKKRISQRLNGGDLVAGSDEQGDEHDDELGSEQGGDFR